MRSSWRRPAAVLLPQSELTPESVALIRNYSREQLLQMASRLRPARLAKPDAAAIVAQACEAGEMKHKVKHIHFVGSVARA